MGSYDLKSSINLIVNIDKKKNKELISGCVENVHDWLVRSFIVNRTVNPHILNCIGFCEIEFCN